ncbi:hypothetical protein RKD18_001593 [Streptomyces phaeoluteigriseus]
MVDGVGDQVLHGRPPGALGQFRVVAHVGDAEVVEPAHTVQYGHGASVVGVRPVVRVEGDAADDEVEAPRALADRGERLLVGGDDRAPGEIDVEQVTVVVRPHLRLVRRSLQPHRLPPGSGVVGGDAGSVRGAGDPRDDGAQRGVLAGDRGPLGESVVRVAEHADDPVGPGLAGDPLEGVVAVVDLSRPAQSPPVRTELAADVLDHHDVAARGEPCRDPVEEGVPAVLVVGQAGQDGRCRLRLVGAVHVGGQSRSVAHAHHALPCVRRDGFRGDAMDGKAHEALPQRQTFGKQRDITALHLDVFNVNPL